MSKLIIFTATAKKFREEADEMAVKADGLAAQGNHKDAYEVVRESLNVMAYADELEGKSKLAPVQQPVQR